MVSSVKLGFATTLALLLTGCVPIEPLQQSSIADSPRQMCDTAKENKIRAESMYKNRRFISQATFTSVSEGSRYGTRSRLSNTYIVNLSVERNTSGSMFNSQAIRVWAQTASQAIWDQQSVANLSKGQKVQVSGIVTGLNIGIGNDCTISLEYATFSPA